MLIVQMRLISEKRKKASDPLNYSQPLLQYCMCYALISLTTLLEKIWRISRYVPDDAN